MPDAGDRKARIRRLPCDGFTECCISEGIALAPNVGHRTLEAREIFIGKGNTGDRSGESERCTEELTPGVAVRGKLLGGERRIEHRWIERVWIVTHATPERLHLLGRWRLNPHHEASDERLAEQAHRQRRASSADHRGRTDERETLHALRMFEREPEAK